jgi:hypothetical protein
MEESSDEERDEASTSAPTSPARSPRRSPLPVPSTSSSSSSGGNRAVTPNPFSNEVVPYQVFIGVVGDMQSKWEINDADYEAATAAIERDKKFTVGAGYGMASGAYFHTFTCGLGIDPFSLLTNLCE